MPKMCRLYEHEWEPMRGGKRERCTKCLAVFPCLHECKHLDCIVETGRQLPDWISEVK